MVMYATATELAGYMQQDLDTYTATQVLTLASAQFDHWSGTAFTPTTTTYRTTLQRPLSSLTLPYYPVISVSAVRINGVAQSVDWILSGAVLYRAAGFGGYAYPASSYGWVPDVAEVDLTYGYSSPPDDVKQAVLDSAAAAYSNPDPSIASEQIDDYQVVYSRAVAVVQLTPGALELAKSYRVPVIA